MKKLQTVSFGVVTIFILVSCSLFTPKESQNDSKLGNVNLSVTDLPPLDLEGSLPSPGAASLRALAVDEPGVAALVDDVEASERAALQAAIEELQAQTPPHRFHPRSCPCRQFNFRDFELSSPGCQGILF